MERHVALCGALCAAVLTLAACTSSGSAKTSSSSPTPPPSTPATTSAPPPPTPTPTPTVPLSPFEQDPAVKALRAWAAETARTINVGKYDSAALDKLMTPYIKKSMKILAGPEVGRHYPGPLPFTPVKVIATSATAHTVDICFVTKGYSLDPKTGKPSGKKVVTPVAAAGVLSGARWLVSDFAAGTFSCSGVAVKEPSF